MGTVPSANHRLNSMDSLMVQYQPASMLFILTRIQDSPLFTTISPEEIFLELLAKSTSQLKSDVLLVVVDKTHFSDFFNEKERPKLESIAEKAKLLNCESLFPLPTDKSYFITSWWNFELVSGSLMRQHRFEIYCDNSVPSVKKDRMTLINPWFQIELKCGISTTLFQQEDPTSSPSLARRP